ncbi:ABC transporter-like [Trema orientale]|uniref:ABC transporter-like n=1 Tax=Trema orientale TaxID=63057 RepID=A0A2P5CWN7_TREOI|nr:ABC transporter-like [Trema orientale]
MELEQLDQNRNGNVEKDTVTSTTKQQVIDIVDGSKLQHEPSSFVLTFSNITYSVKHRRKKFSFFSRAAKPAGPEEKTILNDISGQAYDGEILALLGASGSGKTTLIDALANRIERGSLKGTVTLNGEFLASRISKAIIGYVMQDDLLYPMLTVEETLSFAAEFRLPRTLSKSKKKARVRALIDQLGLRNAVNTMIGDEAHRGISGGERRRVSIGLDVIHEPILLFLDEPTSGLDSTSAFMVVKALKSIAQSGSVVIMTVHQPSYRIVGLLDRLIFLSCGKMVYNGTPRNLPPFCSGFGHAIPENANQIEFFLDLVSELESSSEAGIGSLVEYFNNQNSGSGSGSVAESHHILPPLEEGISSSGSTISNFANPFWVEILLLSQRSMINYRRAPQRFGIRLLTLLVSGVLLATIFWQLDDSAKGIGERTSFFALAVATPFISSGQSIALLLQERNIFNRETAYNSYRRSSYMLSHVLTTLPLLFILALAYSATTFWPVGLVGGLPGFLFYFLIIYCCFWAGDCLVVFLSGFVTDVLIGYTVVLAISAYFLVVSGFFITRDRIPHYWIWLHYLSLAKYPFEAVMRNEFEDPARCFRRGVEIFDNTPFSAASAAVKTGMLGNMTAALGVNITNSTCMTTGLDVLKQRGITELSKWECLVVLVALGLFYGIMFYITLLLGRKNKRK